MTEDRVEKMSVMRKKIAEHMTFSKQTSAHVTSVYEIDMTNVAKFRALHKDAFQQQFGTKLTFMPFIFQAVTSAIRQHRILNSQVSGDDIIYKSDINLGMAVALDWGLIVPVIRNADNLSLAQLAVAANDLADRARTKKLSPNEVTGGTFTITNPGVFGSLIGTPIIPLGTSAILCPGATGGGIQRMYLWALDERLAGAVPVCYISSYETHMGATACMCEVPAGILRHTNQWEILALHAPRPLFCIAASRDVPVFQPAPMLSTLEKTRDVYELYDKEKHVTSAVVDSGHDYNKEMRELLYRHVAKYLLGRPDDNITEPDDLPVEPISALQVGLPANTETMQSLTLLGPTGRVDPRGRRPACPVRGRPPRRNRAACRRRGRGPGRRSRHRRRCRRAPPPCR